ncbi:FkbM family methyltransferase [Leptolyngbya sp. NK1-12]|uniref:FkbM family methyltransferase n=1 Tax=Leptolyngbya sp. NK1-12 TaxID=2547451 RepID=A0AA96WKQ4_9CYAN|nr:FkbM family methyltransferase [Leptolyngbya sp. NK1-12]WNZ27667.1 FkbM family methyltransferase [Leptolyngbya sp. NK1-12]
MKLLDQVIEKVINKLEYHESPLAAKYRSFIHFAFEIEGIKIPMGDHISPKVQRAFHYSCYERPEIETLKSYLASDDVVMELGTGLGLLSIYCAQKIGSDRIFSYEANPRLEPYIRKNYQLNQVSPSLDICLLSNTTGEQDFYITKDFWASSTVPPVHYEVAEVVKVPVKSFDVEVQRIDPTFLIVDIEGGEYSLIENFNLRNSNICKIMIEIHTMSLSSHEVEALKSKLFNAGFKLVSDYVDIGQEVAFLQR